MTGDTFQDKGSVGLGIMVKGGGDNGEWLVSQVEHNSPAEQSKQVHTRTCLCTCVSLICAHVITGGAGVAYGPRHACVGMYVRMHDQA